MLKDGLLNLLKSVSWDHYNIEKMKFHWGHKIGLVYCLFAGFMIFMLIMSRQSDHQLVTENYYENELAVQGKIEANKNLNNADFEVEVRVDDRQIIVVFSNVDAAFNPAGSVTLYKPDNEAFDEVHELQLDEDNQMVLAPKGNMGRYAVLVSFEMNGIPYFKEKEVLL